MKKSMKRPRKAERPDDSRRPPRIIPLRSRSIAKKKKK